MAARRPGTTLQVLEGGHIVHFDNPAAFNRAVKEFLLIPHAQQTLHQHQLP